MFKAYLKNNLVHKFELAPELEIELRVPTALDEADLERFLAKKPNLFEIFVYQIALIFVRTNITHDDGTPLATEDMGFGERLIAIYGVPADMIAELIRAYYEFYPGWKMT